ncbi:hypothetical protein CONPUDRAFT_100894 [Coniophora puteana RWD-64-598 SS2]|uniref:FAD-binding domain-containing protein n=1 Tax=Coniophora puteana (strain RWD-64-598) TaxID=741705 RepID=A0A5M3MTV8_CONPW|nr:uncharacterized protein CONPUDRAFT_100894 [Coniophora puteana RWD-64-598 SS2]EIW82593.1 hypothetical protein CONPUDRAFT_100894 [Coniophora puteana RWD-64-598 SS2]
MSTQPSVLIVGSGPSGLVAALTFLQNNIPIRIIDKSPSPHPSSRGSGIMPRTQDLLHQLGATDLVEALEPMVPIRTYKPGGLEIERDFLMFTPKEGTPHFPYMNPKMMGQSGTEAYLRGHIAKFSCQVEYGTELRSLEQKEDGVVAHIAKKIGDQETLEIISVQYLIGADGAKGTVRRQLDLPFVGNTQDDVRTVLGDICLTAEGVDRQHIHRFGDPKAALAVLLPSREVDDQNDGWQVVVADPTKDMAILANDETELVNCIKAIVPVEVKFRKLVSVGEWRPNVRMTNTFSVGRVFICGDAAHVHSPAGGQGLNSGIQDSINIAWKLSLVIKHLSPPSLLETYSAERVPVISEMLNLTTEMFYRNRNFSSSGNGFERPEKLRMHGVNYRSSSVVLEERNPGLPETPAYGDAVEGEGRVLVAGDRAPDAPALVDGEGTKYRLFDLFKMTHHTVLVFAPSLDSAKPVLDALAARAGGTVKPVVVLPQAASLLSVDEIDALIVSDGEDYAYSGYQVKQGETYAVAVRPDGFIGAITASVEGVQSYFSKVLL